ncbi:MAG: dTDP-glucose 4,6-dehydratase 2 [Candidatus Aminicenantes bacterium ADurb.Bin508]|nr:MAG: dTDP-glucose 4,6-dehydratase 2 [Candidatus Aminicenantes bacterium ADurb.Bin508]
MNHRERTLRRVLVTGGCGFIGTNFIRYLFEKTEFSGKIINLDKLTYAGNPKNLEGLAERYGAGRYRFLRGDIGDAALVEKILREEEVDTIVHFAAESHVDRSIRGPEEFVRTNVLGTFTLLEAARKVWESSTGKVFHHVSTDEVFGSLGPVGFFTEGSPYDPGAPIPPPRPPRTTWSGPIFTPTTCR